MSERSDRTRWEERYARTPTATGAEPSSFVRRQGHWLRGRVLDVAAGAGRNALWLARRGATVHAVDLAIAGLRRAQAAAREEHLDLACIQADLEQFPLPVAHYDAAVNVRYLQRSLFAGLRRTVRPGGVILIETFLLEQQQVGHPSNPEFLLRRGELATKFAGFEFLHLEEGLFEDDGAPAYLSRMLARRPEGD